MTTAARQKRKTAEEWLADHIRYLRTAPQRGAEQELLLELYDKPERNAKEEREMKALARYQKAAERAKKARAQAAKAHAQHQERERKARTKRLIQLGALVEMAGLSKRDPVELLGGLRTLAAQKDDWWQNKQEKGAIFLNKRKRQLSKPH